MAKLRVPFEPQGVPCCEHTVRHVQGGVGVPVLLVQRSGELDEKVTDLRPVDQPLQLIFHDPDRPSHIALTIVD
jgi:hypothetical protein